MHEHIISQDSNYELFFDWDESFDDRGLTITKVMETNGEPGAALYISMSRGEAEALFDYLYGCINYRPRPEGY